MKNLKRSIYDRCPAILQNLLCSVEGWRNNRLRYGKGFDGWSEFFASSAKRDWSSLRKYQLEQVQQLIDLCYKHIPYYAQTWKRAGIEPGDIKTLEDFAKLPALTKEDLRVHHARMLDPRIPRRQLHVTSTGGSTGTPLIRYNTADELWRHYAAVWARLRPGVQRGEHYATFGAQPVVPARQQRPPFWRDNRAANQRLYSMRHLCPAFLEAYARSLMGTPFAYYQGIKSMLCIVAQYMQDRGLQLPVAPRAVFTTSEQLFNVERELIESAWNTKVWDEYCQGEMCAIIHECQYGNRHVAMDYSYVEMEPVGHDGINVVCELICTSFVCRAAPLIRYRVGDKVLLHENQNCPCARPGPVIKTIYGRVSDYLVTADGRRIPHVAGMMSAFQHIRGSQFYQETPNEVVVRIVASPEYCPEDEKNIRHVIAAYVGNGLGVSICRVRELERLPNGKVPNMISHISFGQSKMDARQ